MVSIKVSHRLFLDVVLVVHEPWPCCPSRCDIGYAAGVFTVKQEAGDVNNTDEHKESMKRTIDRSMEYYAGQ